MMLVRVKLDFTHILSDEDNHKLNHKVDQLNAIKDKTNDEKVFEYIKFLTENFDSTDALEIGTHSIRRLGIHLVSDERMDEHDELTDIVLDCYECRDKWRDL